MPNVETSGIYQNQNHEITEVKYNTMTRIWIENNELDINKGLSNQITYAN